jgi:DNA polymerase-1
LEARLLAYLSTDGASTKVFELGGDVHRQNAADLFSLGLGEITKPHRNFAKTFLYGISYGGDTETMKTKLFCPCPRCESSVPPTLTLKRAELKEAGDRWFRIHKAVPEFQEETARFIRKNHYYESPLGARRWIAKPWGAELERETKNLPMQFGGALLMNQRQVALDRLSCPIIFQMHDSFLLEVPTDKIDYWAGLVKGVMEAPVPGLNTSIPVDVEIGRNWGEMTAWTPAVQSVS